ncbi:hypothetical protein RclHR1_00340026 [Rhizophagus clarus]|uniref:F-box domain-containing protein n=1 Tax=Rhizophagus clarus TaxID=94130 RepID=A0A2Z6R9N9_9GLOM|nr:hypothetical protein RclHR1_00340026 [Rhizophagus clarus]GES92850.1 hypothetical protein GLOIN_2v1777651 [Rhizophagus clarus]
MSKLLEDILYSIFEELYDDKNTLCTCLLVSKTWCEIIIPILWRDPWKNLSKENELSLSNLIISYLTNETKNRFHYFLNYFLPNSCQKPLYNYIIYCKHLNFEKIQSISDIIYKKSNQSITRDKIFKLFINENTKFTHVYIPKKFNEQIHLIPGAERCFSDIKFLSCNTNVGDNVLDGLMTICNSIKELEITFNGYKDNFEIVRLIESQKKLYDIYLLKENLHYPIVTAVYKKDNYFLRCLENSVIKHSDTIQYFKIISLPIKTNLSSLVNLKILELEFNYAVLDNLFLPSLQILRTKCVSVKSLTSFIENTSGTLVEIVIDETVHNEIENERIIRAIYQNCPKLKYLKLLFRSHNILEIEKLLINCEHLNELYIYNNTDIVFNWDNLFRILAKSSPTCLFRFKFYNCFVVPELESLKLFFDNWKGRHPMVLQFNQMSEVEKYYDKIEKYITEGIINKVIFQPNEGDGKVF